MPGIVWLASYPKSGNTWARVFLHHYLNIRPLKLSHFQPDQNGLFGHPVANSQNEFEEVIGMSASELGPDAVIRLRFALHSDLAERLYQSAPLRPPIVKTHDAFQAATGEVRFRAPESSGAIVLIRNPLDIAVSYASFLAEDIDTIIARMARDDTHHAPGLTMPQEFGSWSTNVRSWTEQKDVPVLALQYEDMLSAPEHCFTQMLAFLGLDHDPDRVAACVAQTTIGKLQADEERYLSARSPDTQQQRFFRRGQAGDWRNILTRQQVLRVCGDHAEMMEIFGYLSSAEAWLSSRDQSRT